MRVVISPRSASRTVSAAAPVLERSAVMSTDVSRTVLTKSWYHRWHHLFGLRFGERKLGGPFAEFAHFKLSAKANLCREQPLGNCTANKIQIKHIISIV
jgi:hypothetical protein